MSEVITATQIWEYTNLVTEFRGADHPHIETLPHVKVEDLTEGDDKPFFVVLEIAEEGRVSKNGILYDAYALQVIEEYIRAGGAEALMGHLPPELRDTAFPHTDDGSVPHAGFWVGVKRVGKTLWGKAYISPGEVREYFRKLMAVNGKIGTSIYGTALYETVKEGVRKFRQLVLETIDFAPIKRASLELGGNFYAVSEYEIMNPSDGDKVMTITIADITPDMRKQIFEEELLKKDGVRVGEMEKELEKTQAIVAEIQAIDPKREPVEVVRELREYGRIGMEISAMLGADADVVAIISEMQTMREKLVGLLGKDVSIVTTVQELHSEVMEMRKSAFERKVTDVVAEMTNWKVSGDVATTKLNALRGNFQSQVLMAIGDNRNADKVAEYAQQVWDSGFQVIAESVRDSLAGPGAFVSGKGLDKLVWKPAEDGEASRAKIGI